MFSKYVELGMYFEHLFSYYCKVWEQIPPESCKVVQTPPGSLRYAPGVGRDRPTQPDSEQSVPYQLIVLYK